MNRRDILGLGALALFPFQPKPGRIPVIDYRNEESDSFGSLQRRILVCDELKEHFLEEAHMNADGSLFVSFYEIDIDQCDPNLYYKHMLPTDGKPYLVGSITKHKHEDGMTRIYATLKSNFWAIQTFNKDGKNTGLYTRHDFMKV